MNKRIGLVLFLLVFINYLPSVHADNAVKLPALSKLPQGNVTSADVLGTRDKGIGLKKGQAVPTFSLKNHEGQDQDFNVLLKKAPLLVVFYRGGWCPYCNLQIHRLTKDFPEFKDRGITPVLISVDSPDSAALAMNTYEIPFPVLSDPDLKAHTAFEVVLHLDNETYKRYQGYGIELEDWSKRDHHKIAVASVFIVDKHGVVQWAHTSQDYKTRPSTTQLLAVIDQWLLESTVTK